MPHELETKTHKAFLSLWCSIHLFVQAFPEAGVTGTVGVREEPCGGRRGHRELGQCCPLVQSCAEGYVFTQSLVQPYEKRSPGNSSLSQATLRAQAEDSTLSSTLPPASPPSALSQFAYKQNQAEIPPYRLPPCHYHGTFQQ